jgi:hypothetical protein
LLRQQLLINFRRCEKDVFPRIKSAGFYFEITQESLPLSGEGAEGGWGNKNPMINSAFCKFIAKKITPAE